MRVVQPRDCPRFPFESGPSIGTCGEMRMQSFHGDSAAETCIPRFVHLSHAARTDEGDDFVRSEPIPLRQRSRWGIHKVAKGVVQNGGIELLAERGGLAFGREKRCNLVWCNAFGVARVGQRIRRYRSVDRAEAIEYSANLAPRVRIEFPHRRTRASPLDDPQKLRRRGHQGLLKRRMQKGARLL